MVIIGIDPHKRTHTASALDPATHRVLASLQVDATLAGYRQLLRWATRFEARRWAPEPSLRHYPMPRWRFGAFEPLDDAFALLEVYGLAIMRRTPGGTATGSVWPRA